jgi:hypothetical protein
MIVGIGNEAAQFLEIPKSDLRYSVVHDHDSQVNTIILPLSLCSAKALEQI